MYAREKKVYLKYILKKRVANDMCNAKLFNLCVYSVYVYICEIGTTRWREEQILLALLFLKHAQRWYNSVHFHLT